MVRMTASQFRAVAGKKRLSKEDEARIEKGLDPIETEDRVQERVVRLLENLRGLGRVLWFTSIPNSTRTPYVSVRAKNKRLGLNPGMPDLFIVAQDARKNRKILLLELKREKGGTLSEEQKAVLAVANSVTPAVRAKCAKGYAEAKSAVLEICGMPDFPEE